MLISILADLSILMGTALLLFLFQEGESDQLAMPIPVYVLIETIMGLFLFQFSVAIDSARYDYRFLLYCFSLKYLGTKVTVSSIFLISVFRLFISTDVDTTTSFLFGMLLIVFLPIVYKYIKRIANDFVQLTLLTFFTFFIGAVLNLLLYGDFFRDSQIYTILICSSTLMIIIFLWIGHRIDEIKGKSESDFLTGLKNSRRFYLDLSRLVHGKQEVSVALLDIDYFKTINDTFGHLAGDEVLKKIATIFQNYESPVIQFYRVGGEEFACIIKGYTLEENRQILETIRHSVESLTTDLYSDDRSPRQITLSIGLAKFDPKAEMHQSLRQADLALYEAKKEGRNRVNVNQKSCS